MRLGVVLLLLVCAADVAWLLSDTCMGSLHEGPPEERPSDGGGNYRSSPTLPMSSSCSARAVMAIESVDLTAVTSSSPRIVGSHTDSRTAVCCAADASSVPPASKNSNIARIGSTRAPTASGPLRALSGAAIEEHWITCPERREAIRAAGVCDRGGAGGVKGY